MFQFQLLGPNYFLNYYLLKFNYFNHSVYIYKPAAVETFGLYCTGLY